MLILAADATLLYPMHGPGCQGPFTSLTEPAPIRCGHRSLLFRGGAVHLGIPHLCERTSGPRLRTRLSVLKGVARSAWGCLGTGLFKVPIDD